ncbi:Uncharacterized protein AC510_2598 [Pseudomonas amygdali pv. myricae]|nr:Uncharacterized protein AC510_2598 [Pseudomonas amygdali pv. myricae]
MPLPSTTLRRTLVIWLYAVAVAHVLGSIVFTWAGFFRLARRLPDYA